MENCKIVYIALIGRASSGKSTFINTICENKMCITSSIPQSTISQVRAVYQSGDKKFVFIDSPGLYQGEGDFNKILKKQSLNAIRDSDCILYMIDAKDKIKKEEQRVLFYVKTSGKPFAVLINKADVATEKDIRRVKNFLDDNKIQEGSIFVGSALEDEGLDEVLSFLLSFAKEGEEEIKEDAFSLAPLNFRVQEVIRECIFKNFIEEIPHCICVVVEEIKAEDEKIFIKATIYSNKESQKGMLIGKEGSMIKKLKNQSIKGLKNIFLGKFIELEMDVKINRNWKKDKKILEKIGII